MSSKELPLEVECSESESENPKHSLEYADADSQVGDQIIIGWTPCIITYRYEDVIHKKIRDRTTGRYVNRTVYRVRLVADEIVFYWHPGYDYGIFQSPAGWRYRKTGFKKSKTFNTDSYDEPSGSDE